jgi:hypothetical protein
MKTPILVVVPKRKDYSFIKEGVSMGEGKERGHSSWGSATSSCPPILLSPHRCSLSPEGRSRYRIRGRCNIRIAHRSCRAPGGREPGNPQAGLPPLNGGAIGVFWWGAQCLRCSGGGLYLRRAASTSSTPSPVFVDMI